jgi:glyoxylase-like metal-dependent hydrolase (beta-lactamase superfamily II)
MLFCGDTLFLDAIGRTDLALSSVEDMVLSLKKLKNVKFDTALSGHGRQSSYSDQQQNIDYFIDLLQNLSKYQ